MDTSLISRGADRSRRGVLFIAIAAVLWGTVGIASAALFRATPIDPLSLGFARLAIAAPVLALAGWAILGPGLLRVARRDAPLILGIGVTMALYQVCFFAAIAQVGVAIAVLVTLCSAPAIVAVLGAATLREGLSPRVGVTLLGALAGTALLVGGGSSASGGGARAVGGVMLALGSALGYAIMTLCSRGLAGRYHPVLPMAWGLTISACLLLPFALAGGLALPAAAADWGLLLYLGIVPTALAFVLFLSGMRHTTATIASIITLLEPLTGAALAWLLFGERLGWQGGLGAILLLAAVAWLAWRD